MQTNTLLFVIASLVSATLLLTLVPGSAEGLGVAVVSFSLVWLLSLKLRNASIVDVFWGPGFVVVGLYYLLAHGPSGFRGLFVFAMVLVWALRLGLYIGVRNAGAGEDFRYASWREEAGRSFWWISYFKVFTVQAVVLWIVSSPLLLAWSGGAATDLTLLDLLGFGLWLFGLGYESVADFQMARFKSDPANDGTIMNRGLWSLSRHPNYFGEAVLWWGIGLFGFTAGGWLCLIGPALITFSLLKVSGVTMLDAGLCERRPAYADYMRSTPAFFPVGRAGHRLVSGSGRD